jgi:imidazoleglycerol-phosphate dehydratase
MSDNENSPRCADLYRKTKETEIKLELNLDGGSINLDLLPEFLAHMLNSLALYAGWGLKIKASGDYKVDFHHTVEDIGLVLGEAVYNSLGNFQEHCRFGSALVPMDDALVEVALDAGRRPYLFFEAHWPQATTNSFDFSLIEEFWRAFTLKAGFTLHLIGRHGKISHHLAEAMFKAVGLTARSALAPKKGQILSTKGVF